ncbi:MAG: nitroreductase family protein [Bryobacteraceae bacterium]
MNQARLETTEQTTEFFDVVRRRRSIRAFARRQVEKEKLQRILEAANAAPSAGNLQAYEIYAVLNDRRRLTLALAARDQLFVASAPVALVFCAHPALSVERYGKRAERLYSLQDATIACTSAMLAATAQGLATVWVGAFDDDEVRRILGAPRGIMPVAILPVGYAAEKPKAPERRSLDDLVHWL